MSTDDKLTMALFAAEQADKRVAEAERPTTEQLVDALIEAANAEDEARDMRWASVLTRQRYEEAVELHAAARAALVSRIAELERHARNAKIFEHDFIMLYHKVHEALGFKKGDNVDLVEEVKRAVARIAEIEADKWTCFHCGETFTAWGAAADHFGTSQMQEPGCLIDQVALEEGGKPERGRGLLMALRKAEAEVGELRREIEQTEYEMQNAEYDRRELERRFGTRMVSLAYDRYDNERFRADHACALLAAHGIAFDQAIDSATRSTEREAK